MDSVRASILKVEGRAVTIEILSVEGVEIIGKDVKINGLKTTAPPSRPPKEEHVDMSHALVYQIADGQSTGSLQVNSFCVVTWDSSDPT